MVGADEQRGVAGFVTADLHAAVPAGVQEDVNRAFCVAAEDDGFLTHAGDEEVPGVGNLAFMADEQPGSGK